tara:strand:+ start:444 stop:890 length:447 start_codon:yes stop_codon:yes gene_type:complete
MGIVYMLAYGDMTYIGSTIRSMNKRMNAHEYQYKRWLDRKSPYCSSFNIIKNENYELIIIEQIKNETVEDCREREQWWIDFYGKENLVNKCNANGWNYENIKEYYNNNKNQIKKQTKEYYENNKDKISQQKKQKYHQKKLQSNQTPPF